MLTSYYSSLFNLYMLGVDWIDLMSGSLVMGKREYSLIRGGAYRIPRLIDCNACSRILRGYSKLLIIGRCIEREHPEILSRFKDYVMLSVCLEAEHVNMVGFKLAGIIRRCGDWLKEVAVLGVDGSLHCIQMHFMVEEVFKILGVEGALERRHFIVAKGGVVREIPKNVIKVSRYLARVAELLQRVEGGCGM